MFTFIMSVSGSKVMQTKFTHTENRSSCLKPTSCSVCLNPPLELFFPSRVFDIQLVYNSNTLKQTQRCWSNEKHGIKVNLIYTIYIHKIYKKKNAFNRNILLARELGNGTFMSVLRQQLRMVEIPCKFGGVFSSSWRFGQN